MCQLILTKSKLVLDNPVYMGKIVYGRRKTEKIDGTRNEFHVVKQDEGTYEFYNGIHKAIISEETWYKAHEKRKITGVKHEKTHSMEHYHILSGLVRLILSILVDTFFTRIFMSKLQHPEIHNISVV